MLYLLECAVILADDYPGLLIQFIQFPLDLQASR